MSGVATAAEVGRLVDSSHADDRKMIRLVRERRLLYARNNMPVASFYAQVKRLWEEVATEMNWTVADVRRKWSHIRNSYSRHLRNELHGARTGRGRAVSRWYLADELDFLREHMATDTRPSPFSTYAPSFLELDISEQTLPEATDVKPFLAAPWFLGGRERATSPAALQPPAPAPAPAGAAAFGPAHALGPGPTLAYAPRRYDDDSNSGSNTFGPDENSSYFQFFRGIYNDYQELPERKQRQFKRQCLHLLHELLDEEEECRDTDGPSPQPRHRPPPRSQHEDGFDEKCEVILPNL